MSTRTTTQRNTGLFAEALEARIEKARDWMRQTSPTTEELMGMKLTNGELVACIQAGIIISQALLAAHFKDYGWAVACAGMAFNLAKPVVVRLLKEEGGDR